MVNEPTPVRTEIKQNHVERLLVKVITRKKYPVYWPYHYKMYVEYEHS